MITIRLLSSSGDTPYEFPDTQIDEARAVFNTLKMQGCTMFAVDPETKDTTLVTDLFPNAKVVAVPQISGG